MLQKRLGNGISKSPNFRAAVGFQKMLDVLISPGFKRHNCLYENIANSSVTLKNLGDTSPNRALVVRKII